VSFRRERVSTYNFVALLKSLTQEGHVAPFPTEGAPTERPAQRGSEWGDDWIPDRELPVRRWTREEAQALAAAQPSISPWRVVWVQALVGLTLAVLAGGFARRMDVGLSALYGAVVVVIPALLMARAATSRSALSLPGYAAVSFMMWEFGKILVSVALLAMAPKLLHTVVWPALLAGLIVCIKVYWVALLWRGSKKR
jgi:ATP synthase protein I